MKRVVLLSALSLLDVQLWGVPAPEFSNPISIYYRDVLFVVPKSISLNNLIVATKLQEKNRCYLFPLKSQSENSPSTSGLTSPVSVLREDGGLKVASGNLFKNRKRAHKNRANSIKPINIKVKVPP